MLTAGTLLQERYRVVRLIELGGMGAMYRAWDTQRDVPVSVKELTPQPDLDADALAVLRQQFDREAQDLIRLRHPVMVPVIDYFHGENVAGNGYLVMDFIEGENLAACIARVGALPERQVLAWAEQILDALVYCHSHGVQHRDIKPQNIILKTDGNVVLVGFELAKLWDPNDPRSWTATRVMGTPEYAPPERWGLQTWHIDALSDLYSLGATLYHALTGQVPLTAGERTANPYRFLPVKALSPRVSARTKAAVVKAMELPRGKRFQDAETMKAALADRSPLHAPEHVHPAALMIPTRGERLKNWAFLIVVGIVVLSIAGVLGVAGRTLLDGAARATVSLEVTPVPTVDALPVLLSTSVVVVTPTSGPTRSLDPTPARVPLPPPVTDGARLLSDAFDDNVNNWVVGEYADDWGAVSRAIAEGVYTWNISAIQSVSRWCTPEIPAAANLYLVVDAQRVSGPVDASYGLVFRHSEGSYYLFSVRDDGFFSFNVWYGFAWEAVIDWTGTFAIRPGDVNRLAVQAEGSQFVFYINDEPVSEAENGVLASGESGLSVLLATPGDAVFVFDNFEISER